MSGYSGGPRSTYTTSGSEALTDAVIRMAEDAAKHSRLTRWNGCTIRRALVMDPLQPANRHERRALAQAAKRERREGGANR